MYCLSIAKAVGIPRFLLKSYNTTRTIKEAIPFRGGFFFYYKIELQPNKCSSWYENTIDEKVIPYKFI